MATDYGSVIVEEGIERTSQGRTITDADIATFAGFSGDFAPLHTDDEFAKDSPFGQRIMHGVGTFSICSGLLWQLGVFGPPYFAFLGASFKLAKPVLVGDTIRASVKIQDIRRSSDGTKEIVTFLITGANQRDETVLECDWRLMRPTL